ncbi:YncE family protein [Amycolatopsis suaedae]|uniref:YncE family protein n=1 Tax=Amycolatopsis suaedae TaxID=2510978 RepID=A0A4Q7J908_9PSEU|nr:YncE family protein [Amycolatopsis suaedae]RZQ64220.1 hypothetical protein EWH70_09565 [Amycolatopsis suaedae]
MRKPFAVASTAVLLAAGTLFAPAAAAAEVKTVTVGDRPTALDVNSETGMIYVANTDSGTVSVVEGASNLVVATIGVGGSPSDVAVNDETKRVYVASPVTGTITVIDGESNTIAGVIAAGPATSTVDVDETANVVIAGSSKGGAVAFVDGVSNTLQTTVPGKVHTLVSGRVDPGRRFAYFTSEWTGSVEVLDTVSRSFVAVVRVGPGPAGLDLHEATNTLYVANSGVNHLSVVDCALKNEKAIIGLKSAASTVAVHERSGTVYANGGPNGLVKIENGKPEVSGELSLGVNPGDVEVDQRTRIVYATDPLNDKIFAITGF